jgi:hypothetical protein
MAGLLFVVIPVSAPITRIQAHGQTLVTVSRRAADLLIPARRPFRQAGVDDRADARLVDAHAESRCRHHHVQFISSPFIDNAPAFAGAGNLSLR